MKNLILFIIALLSSVGALAQESVVFTYAEADAPEVMWGTGKKEVYNVAVGMHDPAMVGKSITGVEVPVPVSSQFGSMQVWFSTKLDIQLVDQVNVNVPDVGSYDVPLPTLHADGHEWGVASLSLPAPVQIPAGGLYVGYTLSLKATPTDAGARSPIILAEGDDDDGLYIYCSRSQRQWTPSSSECGGVSALRVMLEGDLPEHSVGVFSIGNYVADVDLPASVDVTLSNLGLSQVNSIGYKVSVNNKCCEGTLTLDKPMANLYGARCTVSLPTPACDKAGKCTLKVEISSVNGSVNNADYATVETVGAVRKYRPEYRPLIEEFTGTGCGYCPRGYAAMEYMREKYGNDFVGIAWHLYNMDDPMCVSGYPCLVNGFPGAVADRWFVMDPYHVSGTSDEFNMETWWLAQRENTSPVHIEVKGGLLPDKGTVNAVASLDWQSLPEQGGECRVEFLLSCDALSGTSKEWKQVNNYNGTAFKDMPIIGEMFVGKGNSVLLTYNDVGLLSSGYGGIEGSIPAVELNTPAEVKFSFDLTQALNYAGRPIIQDPDQVNVIALVEIIDAKGKMKVLNSAKARVTDDSAVECVVADAKVVSSVCYSPSGVKMHPDSKGVMIRIDRLEDGSSRVSKIFVK